ncbi:hypothetical protein RRG08_005447 [Elysia crispata]|uniref:Uncharacterized protein n=1 Tax=Elysia crispata TaxID=231223 RepID=A0AAE0Y162_9GAST|nr:hypothetical protein RRG08_005447 [Elysia crispata]
MLTTIQRQGWLGEIPPRHLMSELSGAVAPLSAMPRRGVTRYDPTPPHFRSVFQLRNLDHSYYNSFMAVGKQLQSRRNVTKLNTDNESPKLDHLSDNADIGFGIDETIMDDLIIRGCLSQLSALDLLCHWFRLSKTQGADFLLYGLRYNYGPGFRKLLEELRNQSIL